MAGSREDRIAEFRIRQPIGELQRKAEKAAVRAKLWTQEEIDLCKRKGIDLYGALNWGLR